MGWWPRIGFTRVPAAAMLAALLYCARSPGATQFQNLPYAVQLAHLQQAGGSCTGSTPVPLAHDTSCTLSVSAPQSGDEVLTLGGAGSGGPTLTTSYMITGVAGGDPTWVDSTAFLSRSYLIPGNNTTDTLTLSVRGTAPPGGAPEAGDYTATIVLTITF